MKSENIYFVVQEKWKNDILGDSSWHDYDMSRDLERAVHYLTLASEQDRQFKKKDWRIIKRTIIEEVVN